MIPPAEGILHCGGSEIPYRRRGHGPPLLVVTRHPGSPLDPVDEEALAVAGFRVVVPLAPLPTAAPQADRWMLGLLEGLGLERPGLVLDREAAVVLQHFLQRHGERIGAVTILAGGEAAGESIGRLARILESAPRAP
jgi:hypothetical protein